MSMIMCHVTPKVHAVFFHVEDFCASVNDGLGPWSEQSSESVHHDFGVLWQDFKVKSIDHPNYRTKLLSCVCLQQQAFVRNKKLRLITR